MDELAAAVARERRLLEVVLFKLIELTQLVGTGEYRFVALAADEVDRALDRLIAAGLERGLVAEELAGRLDVPVSRLGLAVLAGGAVEPYRTIFADHHAAVRSLVAEIQRLASAEGLGGRGLARVREALTVLAAGATA